MTSHPPFRKVFSGVATWTDVPVLRGHYDDLPPDQLLDGRCYAGEWFEIPQDLYDEALNAIPPLFMRGGMFAMTEFKGVDVTSVYFSIRIRARQRWFHGYCDLTDPRSPEAMRAAIIAHETGAVDSMTREEKLELIWNTTPDDYRGIAGASNPDAWQAQDRGKRTILVNGGGAGTILTLLEDLSDDQIAERLGRTRFLSVDTKGDGK